MNKNQVTVLNILLQKNPGHVTYPAELEKLSKKEITRAGAKIVCDKLVSKGILKSEKKRSKTWSKTTSHYSIGQDMKSLQNLVRDYFQNLAKDNPFSWQKDVIRFYGSQFIKSTVNSDFVRDKLFAKNVLIFKIINQEKNRDRHNLKFRNSVAVPFPIRPSKYRASQMLSIIKTVQKNTISEKQEKIEKIIKWYYNYIEEKEIILPILALIKTSPTALEYFLSDWNPHVVDDMTHYTPEGIHTIEHVLFRLIWNTINDLSIIRDIPQNNLVSSALVYGGRYPSSKTTHLLEITLTDLSKIAYDAGFDTHHDYYGDGENIVEIETNPENCRVKITYKDKSHIEKIIKTMTKNHKSTKKKRSNMK